MITPSFGMGEGSNMEVHPLTKIACIVCLYAFSIGAVLFFYWIIYEQLQAMAQSAVVQVQSGVFLILLPLIAPVFHIIEVLDNKIKSRKIRAAYRKMQSTIIVGSFIIIIGAGFSGTQMVMYKIHAEGYQKCEFVTYMTRSKFTYYSKDPALCPTS